MTAPEIVKRATWDSARYVGQEQSSGSIEKGKRADFFLVPGDPTKDLKAISRASVKQLGATHRHRCILAVAIDAGCEGNPYRRSWNRGGDVAVSVRRCPNADGSVSDAALGAVGQPGRARRSCASSDSRYARLTFIGPCADIRAMRSSASVRAMNRISEREERAAGERIAESEEQRIVSMSPDGRAAVPRAIGFAVPPASSGATTNGS
jgi:hypothetical protein